METLEQQQATLWQLLLNPDQLDQFGKHGTPHRPRDPLVERAMSILRSSQNLMTPASTKSLASSTEALAVSLFPGPAPCQTLSMWQGIPSESTHRKKFPSVETFEQQQLGKHAPHRWERAMLILRSSQNPMTPDLHQELGLLNSSLQGIPSESTGRLIVEEKL